MPPRPKYSRGCHACRRMKVKCDEEKPQCRRCTKAGRLCPGFPDLSVFLSMNGDFVTHSPQITSAPRLGSAAREPNRGNDGSPSLQLSKPPSTDWNHYAVTYFLRNFVSAPKDFDLGFLGFLPELFSQRPDVECLRDSVHAVSLTAYSNISSVPLLQLRSRQFYGLALRSTRAALGQSSTDDAPLLASIILLQMCESLNGTYSQPNPHENGLVKLLRARGRARPQDHLERNLLHTIHARLQVSDLSGTCDWADGPVNDLTGIIPRSPQMLLWHLLSQVSQCCRRVRTLSSQASVEGSLQQHQVIDVLETAMQAEAGLAAWRRTLPPKEEHGTCAMPEMSETNTTTQLPFEYKAHFFRDVQDGARWQGYWTSRIHILRAVLDALNLADMLRVDYSRLSTRPPPQRTLQSSILTAVDNICSSVPFMLGEIDNQGCPSLETKGKALGAFFITRSLHLINEIPYVPVAQRHWTLDCLLRIGCGWGIGAALQSRSQWL